MPMIPHDPNYTCSPCDNAIMALFIHVPHMTMLLWPYLYMFPTWQCYYGHIYTCSPHENATMALFIHEEQKSITDQM